ncbi:MAG: DNA-formamidopyrimidine glycosylase family protein [Bacteroidota bacterium]
MPELPEVEGFRKYIVGTALDQRIREVEIADQKVVKDDPGEFVGQLTGRSFTGTDRVGKYLFLLTDGPQHLMMHFGMTGSPHYYQNEEDAPRFGRVVFHFENGFRLAYNCPRKFGRLTLTAGVAEYCAAKKIGPDAASIPWEDFQSRIATRKTPIKAAMMNQSILAGVGNWIVDEVLYQARIHPEERATDLSEADLRLVYDKMIYVIGTALELEAHYPDFPEHFMIHSRWTDSGRPDAPRIALDKIKVGGRSTYFDPKVQVKREAP